MRPRRDCLGDMSLRILVGSLAAVVLGALLACGQSENDEPVQARVPTAAVFDLLESGFHQSTVGVALGRAGRGVGGGAAGEARPAHLRCAECRRSVRQRSPNAHSPTERRKRDGNPLCLRVAVRLLLPLRTANTPSNWKIGGVCSTMWVPSRPCNGRSTRCRNDGSESRR